VLRRFETYAFLPGTSSEARRRLADVLLGAGRHIPEVLGSAVGWNRAPASTELVWEHWFDSPDAYQRYMVHPYHAELIDRYVLADSPERVVETARGAGLFGDHRDEPPDTESPWHLVVLLDVDPATDEGAERTLWEALRSAATSRGARHVGVGANSLANAWFDGVTALPGPPPRWSHVWEAGLPEVALEELGTVLEAPPVRASRPLFYEPVR
jgi:hypothetical protein